MLSILDIFLWALAIIFTVIAAVFTVLVFRELRRVHAIMGANAALERARQSVEAARAKVASRMYSDKTTLDE